MTYKELNEQLDNLNKEQLEMDVTIYDSEEDEFYGCYAAHLSINKEDDTLDDIQPYLIIKTG
jgi:hypothetical protein